MRTDKNKMKEDSYRGKKYVKMMPTVIIYCLSSLIVGLANRYILKILHMKNFMFLLFCQCFISMIAFVIGSHYLKLFKLKKLEKDKMLKWIPITISFGLMIYTSTRGQALLDIATFSVCKNATTVFVAIGDYFVNGRKVSFGMGISFIIIIFSPMISTYKNLSWNSLMGYIWMLMNMLATTCYTIYMKKTILELKFTALDTGFYNNAMVTPLLLIGTLLFENNRKLAHEILYENDASFNIRLFNMILLSSVAALSICISIAASMKILAPTTFTIVGALNKIPCSMSGYIFIEGEDPNITEGLAIFCSFIGGGLYTYYSIAMRKEAHELKK